MKTIYKYSAYNVIEMPKDAKILWFHKDPNDVACIWAEVDTEKPMKKFKCAVVGTGWPIDDYLEMGYKYFNSIIDDIYVWHLYVKEVE